MIESKETHTPNDDELAHEYLVVKVRDNLYGIIASDVIEVTSQTAPTIVPGMPTFILGVVSFRGKIVPVVDCAIRLGVNHISKPHKLPKLVYLQSNAEITGLLVDDIVRISSVQNDHIYPPPPALVAENEDFYKGVVRHDGELVSILNANGVVRFELKVGSVEYLSQDTMTNIALTDDDASIQEDGKFTLHVVVQAAENLFSLELNSVREVLSRGVINQPGKLPDYISGMVDYRNHSLPGVSLSSLFNLQKKSDDAVEDVMVVVEHDGNCYAVFVDQILEIIRMAEDDIHPLPEIMSDIKAEYFNGVGIVDNGSRAILILNPGHLVRSEHLKELSQNTEKGEEDAMSTKEAGSGQDQDQSVETIVFTIGGTRFALFTKDVLEIIPAVNLTMVPHTHNFVAGIFIQRGAVVPCVDMRLRLGVAAKSSDNDAKNKIIVVNWENQNYGLIANEINEIRRFPAKKVMAPPSITEGVKGRFVRGLFAENEENNVILLELGAVLETRNNMVEA